MGKLISYLGSSKILKKIADFLNVTDVKVNGTSVVDANGVADIDLSLYVGIKVVQTLPETGVANFIYLVPSEDPGTENVYDEYVWTEDGWELIGSTDIDLSDYYTKTETDDLLDDKADIGDIPTVNDGTLTIQLNGENQQTFTANSSSDKTANIKAVDWVSNGKLGAKNLVPFPYDVASGSTAATVDFTTDNNGIIDIDGTATGGNAQFIICTNLIGILEEGKRYIVNGCVGGASNTYKIFIDKYSGSYTNVCNQYDGEDVEFEMPTGYSAVRLGIAVYSGKSVNHQKIKPMIRLKSDSDNTYQPYSKSNVELTKDTINLLTNVPLNLDKAETGTWNLVRQPYFHSSSSSAGTTRTVNADGSITFTGTASATYNFNIKRYTQDFILPKGSYHWSCCPSGGSVTTYFSRIQIYKNGSLTTLCDDYGNGVDFTLTEDSVMQINAVVYNGYAITDSLVFKPNLTPIKFPACDKTNAGVYTLQATVDVNGNATYSWV